MRIADTDVETGIVLDCTMLAPVRDRHGIPITISASTHMYMPATTTLLHCGASFPQRNTIGALISNYDSTTSTYALISPLQFRVWHFVCEIVDYTSPCLTRPATLAPYSRRRGYHRRFEQRIYNGRR